MSEVRSPAVIAVLGDFPPRLCGIATFTSDLTDAISRAAPDSDCFVGAVNDRSEGYDYSSQVRFELLENDLDSYRRAADFLNFHNTDVLCVQHEFGIYGGPGGNHLLALLEEAHMPVVTTLHTVLQHPDSVQRRVMKKLAARSDRLIVMARKGAEILEETYQIPTAKIEVVAHGIPDLPFVDSSHAKVQFGIEGRQVLLTFGLIGPGKGIEHVIEALPEIAKQHPEVVYVVLGATHPHLLANEGERYRLSLERLARDLGVKRHVIFHNRFVSMDELADFIAATDIYVTPYLNEAQVTSGTLAYVFGAGKVVVSTPYWHAAELLADGRGELVPFRDPDAIASAVTGLLDEPERMDRIRHEAYAIGRGMIWPEAGKRYLDVFRSVCNESRTSPRRAFARWTLDSRPPTLPPRRLDHVVRMSDGTGMFQHALYNVPNYREGYCTDDNARALILCNLLDEIGDEAPSASLNQLASRYLAFLAAAFDAESGQFRNFMGYDRTWLEDAGSEDSQGRALWALGTAAGRSRDEGHLGLAGSLFLDALPGTDSLTSPRAWVFALLGIREYLRNAPASESLAAMQSELTSKLLACWRATATPDWPWFEASVTYENARFPQALLPAGEWCTDDEAFSVGLESLRWLLSIQTTSEGWFRPIGSNGFHERGETPARFDQQPVEAQAMIGACLEAWRVTGETTWMDEAKRVFEWFLGRNDLGVALYDFTTGGCRDGLHPDRANQNQGAESTLAFHISLAELNAAEPFFHQPSPGASPDTPLP